VMRAHSWIRSTDFRWELFSAKTLFHEEWSLRAPEPYSGLDFPFGQTLRHLNCKGEEKLRFLLPRMGDITMAIVLDPPIEKPNTLLTPPILSANPELDRPAAHAPDLSQEQGSRFDGLLMWICVTCLLLLLGMHVYELLAWLLG
jgi:hypothetical protein